MNKNFKKTIGISLAMAVMLSTSGLALAASTTEKIKKTNTTTQGRANRLELTDEEKATRLAAYKEKLDAKVTANTITQAEADELYAAAVAGDFSKAFGLGQRGEKKELTEEEKATQLAKYKEKLETKVTAGTITQAESDELYAAAVAGDYSKAFGKPGHGRKGTHSNNTKETTAQ